MKKLSLIILIAAISQTLYSQQFLIVKDNGILKIINYDLGFNDQSNSSDNIILDEIFEFDLVGYNWHEASLVVSLRRDGLITERSYDVSELREKLLSRLKADISNLRIFYFHSDLPYAQFDYGNIKIKNKNGFHVLCYSDEKLLWEKVYSQPFPKSIGISGAGYQGFSMSPKMEAIAFQVNRPGNLFGKPQSSIVEIDILSGKETTISKKGFNPSYSSNGRYLLYQNGINSLSSIIFDREKKQILKHYSWKSAFWLYR
jgi:hypothetical protein